MMNKNNTELKFGILYFVLVQKGVRLIQSTVRTQLPVTRTLSGDANVMYFQPRKYTSIADRIIVEALKSCTLKEQNEGTPQFNLNILYFLTVYFFNLR